MRSEWWITLFSLRTTSLEYAQLLHRQPSRCALPLRRAAVPRPSGIELPKPRSCPPMNTPSCVQ